MKPFNFIAAVIIFGLGVGGGWWLAQLHDRAGPLDNSAPEPVQTQPQMPARTPDTAAVQWLSVESGEFRRVVPAVVLRERGLMLASLYQLFPSSQVVLRKRGTEPSIFPRVVAASSHIPLVALTWDGADDTGFELSSDSGSLYLGKEVVLHLPNERVPATIQSALRRDERGVESFGIDLQRATGQIDGPLVERNSTTLIGFVTAARSRSPSATTTAQAVDALQIATLLDNYRLPEAMSISRFNRYWSDTADGLRLTAEQAFAKGNWPESYRAVNRLWSTASDFDDRDQLLLTRSAFRYALRLIDEDKTDSALEVVSAIRPQYPDAQAWCLVEAKIYEFRRQLEQAIRSIGECLDHPPRSPADVQANQTSPASAAELSATYRTWVEQLAGDPAHALPVKVAVLQRALDREPHALMYRLLADLQYEAGWYAQARRNYELAIQLQPSLREQLAARLATSEQRTATVPVAEIPFEARRGSIIVSGRLNNSLQSFRLLVDTGATYSALSRATLLRLGLSDVFSRGAPVIELESAAGPIYVQRFQLDTIALGAARVDKVPVVLLENLEGVDGLIGLSFLRHFGVELDQQAGKLILTRL